jgi:hypothetical protein
LVTAWQIFALCLAVWIAIKHFRELQQSTGWAFSDCFMMLVGSHVFYFARWGCNSNAVILSRWSSRYSFVAVSCVGFLAYSPQFVVRQPQAMIGIAVHLTILYNFNRIHLPREFKYIMAWI